MSVVTDTPITPIDSLRGTVARLTLIADTPLFELLQAMKRDLAVTAELEPHGGACAALGKYVRLLAGAITEARSADVWVSTEDAARLRDTSPQAVTKLCRQNKLVCRMVGGAWEIHKDSVLMHIARARRTKKAS